jgi:hypothetical protein
MEAMRFHLRTLMVIVALWLSVLTAAFYVVGYFALSESMPGLSPGSHYRVFPSPWLTTIYKPAAHVESAVTGEQVDAGCR